MKNNMLWTSLVPVLALSAVPAAVAASESETGPYMGVNLGAAQANVDDESIARHLRDSGLTVTGMDNDGSDVGAKVFFGYRLDRHMALEAGYFDMGEFGFTATTSPPGMLDGRMELHGLYLDPVILWPITERFSAMARVGVTYAEATTTYSASGAASAPPDREKRAFHSKFGAGIQYDFSEPFSVRAEAERYHIDDAVGNEGDVALFTVGLIYRFAKPRAPVAQAVVAPAPARAPLAPEPIVAVAPADAAPVRTEQYCSILDIEFEINLAEIQREKRERLSIVATFLTKYPEATAVIEGHTDNVGSEAANMALSQRRAESVVQYLVEKHGIDRSRLKAVGYGESMPAASNDTEDGKRQNRRIGAVIACATDIGGLAVKPARITMAMDIEFDLNKSQVKPQYHNELRHVADFLKANPGVTATVEGHTANLLGSLDEGLRLSQQRADSVVAYLVDHFAIERSRLDAQGFGKTRRYSYNTTVEGQQANRRVNVVLNYPR